MLETLRAWLNGDRNYYTGVAIYSEVGDNPELVKLLHKGKNDFRTQRLEEELLSICNHLKTINHGTAFTAPASNEATGETTTGNTDRKPDAKKEDHNEKDIQPLNPELYNTCKLAADNKYKEVMNKRAELFALAKADELVDPNKPDRIFDRGKLAIDIVEGYKEVSTLYDEAEYVKVHGHLKNQNTEEKNEYDILPDHLVKQTLDNLRKNYNKMKNREATPVRVALLQKHDGNIKKLEGRWHSLKPQ